MLQSNEPLRSTFYTVDAIVKMFRCKTKRSCEIQSTNEVFINILHRVHLEKSPCTTREGGQQEEYLCVTSRIRSSHYPRRLLTASVTTKPSP